jgi:5-(carboxyamino)imidazole ribonucleotide synthase
MADKTIIAAYNDPKALSEFSELVEAVTIEFENLPVDALEYLESKVPVRPGSHVLYTTQHRLREKKFLSENNFPLPQFREINHLAELETAISQIGIPCVLKTAGFGYDGKGQFKITSSQDAGQAFEMLQGQTGVLEAWVNYVAEYSVIGIRGHNGEFTAYGPVENRHKNHILDITLSQGNCHPQEQAISLEQVSTARKLAQNISEKLNVTGLLTVELFLTQDGQWLVNELAPRPHNSGHYTMDACKSSQFDQQVLALCGLPLGDTHQHSDALMLNLLGDWWFSEGSKESITPDWSQFTNHANAHLHLYGKAEARPGRKMGHVTFLNTPLEEAIQLRKQIQRNPIKQ